ncbi:Nn.00g108450.m01.CDS01 [Neocucurbitaria sp. VM-36]
MTDVPVLREAKSMLDADGEVSSTVETKGSATLEGSMETMGEEAVVVKVDTRVLNESAPELMSVDIDGAIKLNSKDPPVDGYLVVDVITIVVLAELNKDELNLTAVVSV